MKRIIVLTVFLICILSRPFFALAAGKVPLRIDPAPASVKGYPVSTGIPFARGALKNVKNIRVLDANGKEVPSQARLLATWDTGGVKAALVSFQADVEKDKNAVYQLGYGGATGSAIPAKPVKVSGTDTLSVDTGVLSFRVAAKKFALTDFTVNGRQVAGSADLVLRANGKE